MFCVVVPQVLHAEGEGLRIFAASSLMEPVTELARNREGEVPVLVFAASSQVARQVARGAPADVVLLADRDWAEWLSAVLDRPARGFAGNRLALFGRGAPVDALDALPGVIAMAELETVPAGRYGKAAFEALGLWEDVAPRVVLGGNVHGALRFVDRGEADYGIGYASDALVFPDLSVLYLFDEETHPPIAYYGIGLTPAGEAFLDRLRGPEGQAVLSEWGFLPFNTREAGNE